MTAYTPDCLAGFISRRQRSWDSTPSKHSPANARRPFSRLRPTFRFRADRDDREAIIGSRRDADSGTARRSPAQSENAVSASDRRQLPRGFALSGPPGTGLRRDFARRPLSRFAQQAAARRTDASECQSAGTSRECARRSARQPAPPSQSFAPRRTEPFESPTETGLWIRLPSRRTLPPTADSLRSRALPTAADPVRVWH